MKHFILLLSFLVVITTGLLGQSLLVIEPTVVRKQVNVDLLDPDYEEVSKVTVRNQSPRTMLLRWDKVAVQQPPGWESQVCDDFASYPPNVTTNYNPLLGIQAPVVLAPGETFDLYLHVQPYGKGGEATYEIPFRFTDEKSPVLETAVFHVRINDNNQPNTVNSQLSRLYPNPANDRFYVSNQPDLSRIEVHNTLGRRVKSFAEPVPGAGFDISDLPEGVYLVILVDKRGKNLRTLRLIRRGFRP